MSVTEELLNRVTDISRSYGATRLIVFGSALESPESARDLDLACDGVPGWNLFALGARIENELEISTDVIPLQPRTRFTQHIEKTGKELL